MDRCSNPNAAKKSQSKAHRLWPLRIEKYRRRHEDKTDPEFRTESKLLYLSIPQSAFPSQSSGKLDWTRRQPSQASNRILQQRRRLAADSDSSVAPALEPPLRFRVPSGL